MLSTAVSAGWTAVTAAHNGKMIHSGFTERRAAIVLMCPESKHKHPSANCAERVSSRPSYFATVQRRLLHSVAQPVIGSAVNNGSYAHFERIF